MYVYIKYIVRMLLINVTCTKMYYLMYTEYDFIIVSVIDDRSKKKAE